MSEPAVRAELSITLKDGVSGGIKAITNTAEQSSKRVYEASAYAAKRSAAATEQATAAQRSSYEKLSHAREALNARSEQAIQDEIRQTQRAYAVLSAAGFASAEDQARAFEKTRDKITRLTNEMGRLTSEQQKAAEAAEAANSRQRSGYERFSRAREVLGVRSENAIQREIQQTEAAYKRLEASGTLSSDALAHAAEKMREKITRLTNEMGKLTAEQRRAAQEAEKLEKAQSGIRHGVVGAAGTAAAGYTLAAPAKAAMSFDERLANMANTAYAERDAAGRKVGIGTLEATINRSTQPGIGGGTREQAAEALDAMISKNTLGYQRSLDFLPTVMRTASGANADPKEIANLTSVLVGQKIVANDRELKVALNMITASGQAGGFEIKDMARWLSQQMPDAGRAGLLGLDGLQKVLAMNQAAVMTAGTADEAGNNVKNLLVKLVSKDTGTDFEKAGRGDLAGYMVNQRLKGVDAVTAWQNIIDQEAANDPRLKAALAKLAKTKDKGEQAQIIESIKALSEGSVIGKYFQDMQAVGALMGLRNKDVVGKVDSAISRNRTEYGVNDVNYEVMSGTASFQVRAAQQAKDAAQKDVMDILTPAITAVSGAFTDLATKYPLLTGTTMLATGALTALATASGLASMAMGGGKGGAIAQAATKYAPALGGAAKFAGRASVAGVGALAGGYVLDKTFGEDSVISRYGSSAFNGAAIGATVGSIVPILGTGIGAAVGLGVGTLYEGIKDLLKPAEQKTNAENAKAQEPPKSAEQKPVDVNAKIMVGLAPGLVLQSQSVKSSGGGVNVNTGSMWSTP
ncbi:MAG: phage tail tape measure protein [Nitrosomonadales bacterium]|nr:phage tail tape measure protein [Nitrosomonadales bacterium]